MDLIQEIEKHNPKSLDEFNNWYHNDFGLMAYNDLCPIEKAPNNFIIDVISIWLKEKGFKPAKYTKEEILAIFKIIDWK